jgi:hypothetical protein
VFPNLVFKSADEGSVETPTSVPLHDDGLPDDAPPPDAILCEECLEDGRTTVLAWSGRGRKPKKCDDHKRKSRSSGTSPRSTATSSPRRRSDARLKAIEDDLLVGIGKLAGTVVTMAPVTAATMAMRAPDAVSALVSIASRYPRMLDGLEAAVQVVPFMEIGQFVAAVSFAFMVDLRIMQPYGIAAELLGVAEAAEKVGYQKPTEEVAVNYDYQPADVPPPAFQM